MCVYVNGEREGAFTVGFSENNCSLMVCMGYDCFVSLIINAQHVVVFFGIIGCC